VSAPGGEPILPEATTRKGGKDLLVVGLGGERREGGLRGGGIKKGAAGRELPVEKRRGEGVSSMQEVVPNAALKEGKEQTGKGEEKANRL